MKNKFFASGSVIVSLIASACCIAPVIFALIGLNSISLFSIFEPYRPYLVAASVILLGVAFYFAYNKKETVCEDGSCKIESAGKWNKISVWIAAVASVLIISLPLWGNQLTEKIVPKNQSQSNNYLTIMNDTCSNSCNLSANESNNCCSEFPDPTKFSKAENSTRKFIYNFIIANHRAPGITEIQKYQKLNKPDKVREILKNLCSGGFIDLNRDNIIAAFPFSPKPTNNKVIFEDGRWAYAMCALDALGISKMMNEDVVIESTTPLDKRDVKVAFKNEIMKSITPENALVWYSTDEGSFAKVRCREINFFANKDELHRWKERYPSKKGMVLSVYEALKSSQLQFGSY